MIREEAEDVLVLLSTLASRTDLAWEVTVVDHEAVGDEGSPYYQAASTNYSISAVFGDWKIEIEYSVSSFWLKFITPDDWTYHSMWPHEGPKTDEIFTIIRQLFRRICPDVKTCFDETHRMLGHAIEAATEIS